MYGNRGMGMGMGQPQPQRQGGNRRSINNRNFGNNRNSRFDQPYGGGGGGYQNQNRNFNNQQPKPQPKVEQAKPVSAPVVAAKVEPKVEAVPAPTPAPAKTVTPNKPAPATPVQSRPASAQSNPPQAKPVQNQAQNRPAQNQNQNANRPAAQTQNANQNRPAQNQNQNQNRPPQQNATQQNNQQNRTPVQNQQNQNQNQNTTMRPPTQPAQQNGPPKNQQNQQANQQQNKPQQQQNQTQNKPQQQNQNQNKPQAAGGAGGAGGNFQSNSNYSSNSSLNRVGQDQRGGPGGRGGRRQVLGDKGGPPGNREEHFMMAKLKELSGSMVDIAPLDQTEQKFSGRNRLYIGNLTNDVTEEELLEIFGVYGETSELFVNKEKNFAFIRIDYKANAEKAKREVDGRMRRNRPLRVRFAPHNAAIRVKNLTPFVSNELLHRAFEIFGKVERAVVKVDERGKSLGEGIVEFFRKAAALAAIRHCTERCFFLTASLRPVVVETSDEVDEIDGYTEKAIPRRGTEFLRAREVGPRFADPGSFQHEYGTRWKQLYELYKQKEEAMKRELVLEEEKLEAQMEYAKYEHETELLREQLRQREQDRERQKRSWEMAEQQVDELREKERENILRQQEDMAGRIRNQDDELMRRQQQNTLFMKAQQLSRILDQQEQGLPSRGYDGLQDSKRGSYDGLGGMQMDSQYGMDNYDSMGGGCMGYDDGHWGDRQDDFPNKRRRY